MKKPQGIVHLLVIATCVWLLPTNATGLGLTSVSGMHGTVASAMDSACPSGHNWDSLGKTKASSDSKTNKSNVKTKRAVTAQKMATDKVTHRISTSKSNLETPGGSSPRSRSAAHVSCTESCRAELDACQTPGSRKGKTGCKSMYNMCVQSC